MNDNNNNDFFPKDNELNKLLTTLNKITNDIWEIKFSWITINRVFNDPRKILTARIFKMENNKLNLIYNACNIDEVKIYLSQLINQIKFKENNFLN
jgi:hypothetical protein